MNFEFTSRANVARFEGAGHMKIDFHGEIKDGYEIDDAILR